MGHDQSSLRRLRARVLPPRPEVEVDDELAFHLEQRVRDYIARGMEADAARRLAGERLGDVRGVRRECVELLADERRAATRRDWLDDLRQDLRFGVRSAVRTPLFSLLAVLTLALGIGANAAVFGVVKSVLLDALPYADADRLVRVYGRLLDGSQERGALSAGTVDDIRQRQRSFASVSAFHGIVSNAVYGGDEGTQAMQAAWVEPGYFRTLGVSTALGRTFADDDARPDTARVVILTHAAWRRLFAGDSGVIGRDVPINRIPRTVIGVLPDDFVGTMLGEPDFFFALDLEPTLRSAVSARRSHWLGLVGRLAPGVSHDAAGREVAALGEEMAREHPADQGSIRLLALPLREAMVGDTRTPLLVLMACAGLVLLIACANLAGALLSRTLSRRREFAIRVALGAGRGRLVRQLLTESTLLALAGGLVGLLLASLGLAALRGLALPMLPAYADLSLDRGAVLVTMALALVTGIAFGLAPAISAGRWRIEGTLREESRGTSESRRSRQLRGVLVAGQIALCVSLLAGAGLLARSLWAMTSTPLGFQPEGVLTASLMIPGSAHPSLEARNAFHERFAERLRGLPGVTAVALTSAIPTRVLSRMGIAIEGAPPPPDDAQPLVLYATVSDDYFRTTGVPLRRGRTFDARDNADAPPAIIVSESFARRFWPGGEALGSRIRLGPNPEAPLITVVGIVGDVRNDPARVDAEPMAYAPSRQNPWHPSIVLVRGQADPRALVEPVRRELAALDPGIPLDRPVPLQAVIAEGLSGRRLPVVLMLAFGALALLLASVGVYALFASMAAAREWEFGVRRALGSSARSIALLVLRQGIVWMAAGLVVGALGVVAISRMLRGLLYGVSAFDPIALSIALTVLLACAAIALLVPVRRAARVDPIRVLR